MDWEDGLDSSLEKLLRGEPKISVACSDTDVKRETLCAAIKASVGHLL
jgi:hypothetical protein